MLTRNSRFAVIRLWVQSLGATQARNLSAGVLNPKSFWVAGLDEVRPCPIAIA